jgi:hypothetical protein
VNPDFQAPPQPAQYDAKTPLLQQGQPPVGYAQQAPPATFVAVPQTIVVANLFRESPVACTCQFCHSPIVTCVSMKKPFDFFFFLFHSTRLTRLNSPPQLDSLVRLRL